MKKFISIILVFVFILSSCEDVLDTTLKGRNTTENFYQTEDDAIAAVNAVYDNLGSANLYAYNLWLIQDIFSDDCEVRNTLNDPNIHQLNQFSITPDNIYTAGVWQESYAGIGRANAVLNYIPDIEMDEDLQNRILGEAHFLRALFYFNLVRMFGDVPMVTEIITTTADNDIARTNKDVIYDLIIEDLDFASLNLDINYPSISNKGRATKGAAMAFLAKVYLNIEEWQSAANYAAEVMELNQYDLYVDYVDNFSEKKYNGIESIFEVQFFGNATAENSRMVISGLPQIYPFPAGVDVIIPTANLINSFEDGDYRYEVTFFDSYFYFGDYSFDPHIWKHWDKEEYNNNETGQSGANFPLMRYAELLLIHAEALNELNNGPNADAYSSINRIRERARNGVEAVLPELSGLSYLDFQTAVYKEKRCETVNEGHRWFDLSRTGKLVEAVNEAKGSIANPQEYHQLLPIPQREMDLNGALIQNDGY